MPQELAKARERMVERQIAGRGVRDERVLAAMREVPREEFVSESLREFAYEDAPLPIEAGQTISQPYIVAHMVELARVSPGDRVLEIGAGSGYAAAVMGRIAKEVYAIERHAELASLARRRMQALGYDNVTIIHGDGTRGLPEKAPFDAILVAAGGPDVPETLRDQLAVGGRLVLPVGKRTVQRLVVVHRTGPDQFEEEDHGAVAFVPLVGEHGWRDDDEHSASRPATTAAGETGHSGVLAGLKKRLAPGRGRDPVVTAFVEAAEPFADFDALARLTERYADRRIVALGEATHGTAEFYEARAYITERLVRDHGFNIVAVEADWPDAAIYDAHVRRRRRPEDADKAFRRFPQWMWRNAEVYRFLERLAAINDEFADPSARAGFYGLDIYSLGASIEAVLDYLDRVDPDAARVARERYGCLTPWRNEPAGYGRMALTPGFRTCEEEVTRTLIDLLDQRLAYLVENGDALFSAEQNARIVASAEAYYRAIYYGDADAWNLRDQHMFDTLERILDHRGPQSRAVVWAHNSHIGDARHTEMGQIRGEHNIGQLIRERFGEAAVLVGFGTDRGTVAAASSWDRPMEIKRVNPARDDSFEGRCHNTGIPAFLADFGEDQRRDIRDTLAQPLLERAIGVVYRPESELMSHYFEAELARQFDAFVWIEETRAVTVPADARQHGAHPRETFPFGV